MPVTAATVKARIRATIEAITTPAGSPQFERAHENQDLDERAPVSGAKREFHVWEAGGQIGAYTHPAESESIETVVVVVQYPGEADMQDGDDTIRSDVQRIRAALDNPVNWGSDVVHQQVREWVAPKLSREMRVLVLPVIVHFFEANT